MRWDTGMPRANKARPDKWWRRRVKSRRASSAGGGVHAAGPRQPSGSHCRGLSLVGTNYRRRFNLHNIFHLRLLFNMAEVPMRSTHRCCVSACFAAGPLQHRPDENRWGTMRVRPRAGWGGAALGV
jgi:hypothetical protein